MEPSQTQRYLDRLRGGDEHAREALLTHCYRRVQVLAQKMFRGETRLRQLDQTDDVLHKALIRLRKALESTVPDSTSGFYGLAAQQIRWVLRDLAEQYARREKSGIFGPVGWNERPEGVDPVDPAGEPANLLGWAEFHQTIERLPEGHRRLFDLLLYQGLTQSQAAAVLGTSERTLKRQWVDAKLSLRDALDGEWPGD